MGRALIIVTGLPGAWINRPVRELEKQGWTLTWPQQDMQLEGAAEHWEDGENIEAVTIHDTLLHQADKNWLTDCAPRYYDLPYPGPREFLAQFPAEGKVVLADPRFCLFLPAWAGLYGLLVLCQITPEESVEWLYRFKQGSLALDECQAIVQHYQDRLQEHSQGFPHIARFSMKILREEEDLWPLLYAPLKTSFGESHA